MSTPEEVVQIWEHLRKQRYEKREREAQLRAATTLLQLKLPEPLSCELLEKLYGTYLDDFWKEKYGELHVTHLVEIERSSGQVRIARWISRLSFQVVKHGRGEKNGAGVSPPGGNENGTRMVEWKGQMIPEKEAYAQGFKGGFERFRDGDDPDDDLDAVVKRLQAEGKLPVLAGV